MHEGDSPEPSRVDQQGNSNTPSSSMETNGKEGDLMATTETNRPSPIQNLSKSSEDDTHRNVIRKSRLITLIYVITTCFLAILSYYGGKLHAHKLVEQEAKPQIVIETLWATPLARTHLRTHPRSLNLTEFNRRLADAVAEDYAAFRANHSNHDLSLVNDLFFEHQVGGPGEKNKLVRARVEELGHRKLPEFGIVARCAANLADLIMQKFGETAAQGCKKRLQGWATLHDSTSRHGLHVHAESTLSIVYYVRMGEGAPLRLYDPRGPRPPFEGSIELWPEEGEMVAFPGWLAHEVDNGSGRRVSLVFNVPGNWEGDEFGGETVGLGRWGKVKGWKLDFGEKVL